ncbi:MAG: glutamate racemase [Bdellovibrionales bacterium]|nr:glutamate racemase [Ramlibacter sp.]
MNTRPICVFDSGVGGLSILRSLRAELPHEDFIYLADSAHAPYGERDDAHVISRARALTQASLDRGAKLVVVACNTATAAAIHLLRAEHPGLPVVGVEPALKPAVLATKTKRIGVMATRGTLASAKFGVLLDSLKGQAEFVLQPCDGLAEAIEQQMGHGDTAAVTQLCTTHIEAMGGFGNGERLIDTLVLGCTHYPFAMQPLVALVGPQVRIIETGEPVARHTRRLLLEHGLLNASQNAGQLTLDSTGDLAVLTRAAGAWLSGRDQLGR